MGWWDDFWGKSSRKTTDQTYTQASNELDSGYSTASDTNKQGRDDSTRSLTSGYDKATENVKKGSDNARTDINTNYDKAYSDLESEYGKATQTVKDYLAKIEGYLNPWIDSGKSAQNLYDVAIGTGGTDADRAAYYDRLKNEFADRYGAGDSYQDKNYAAKYNALGITGGRAAKAFANVDETRYETRVSNELDRLERSGERGGQYASTLSGYTDAAGNRISTLQSNLGNQKSSLNQNRGDRLATISSNEGNTLADYDYRYGKDSSDVYQNYSNNQSNLDYSYGQQKAGNTISYGNATNQNRNTGVNNLLNLLGTAAKGYSSYKWGYK